MSAAREMLCDTARAVFAEAATAGIAPVADAGFALLLIPEDEGGFGGDWGDVNAVLQIAGVLIPDLPVAALILHERGDALHAAATVSLMAGAMGQALSLSIDDLIITFFTGSGAATPTVADQLEGGDDSLAYAKYLSWRGVLPMNPPNRPEPARMSASAAERRLDWKYGFVVSKDHESGALHLPPARVSFVGGNVDDMEAAPMADVTATVATFTVDSLAYSPSPPVVFAVCDFDGGGRLPVELTDVRADQVSIGMQVEMTFRRLNTADGIANYFWKARPAAPAVPGAAPHA